VTESLPTPLTPPDCDLRRFRDMPLDVGRLRDSELITHSDPEAIIAALLLWGTAWHQVPAASLPDDDRLLAKYAGYGRSVEAWLRVKVEALRGFVLCADARLYHRTLAQKALDAWDKVQRYDYDREKDRHRKAEKDLAEHDRTDFPTYEAWRASRAHGCTARATPGETPQKRQESLPLEFPRPSGGTGPVRAPTRATVPRVRGASSMPDGHSGGNDEEFQRNESEIPADFALKERKGKELESTQPDSSHSNPRDDDETRDGTGREEQPGRLANADLKAKLDAVLDAAGWHPSSPVAIDRALKVIEDWTKRGIDFDTVVIPSIKAVIAEASEPTRTLGRFRARVDHEHARQAAKPNGAYRPPASPILDPPGEDPALRPMRYALLERLGPQLYSLLLNPVVFEPDGQGDKRLLRVNGMAHMVEIVVNGTNAPAIRAAAREAGFTELWKGGDISR
jgi:hypothetical protein